MVPINLQKIYGRWGTGFALDLHTTSSTYLGIDEFGHERFDNVHSPIGDLLRRLKYKSDRNAASEIIETAQNFLQPYATKFDIIIPVPPSTRRSLQPVILLAAGIGSTLSLPIVDCIKTTRPTPKQLKDVQDAEERKKLLDGLYTVDAQLTEGKRILLFDDLFRSGATMNAITDVLMETGKAQNVHAFTITRTRRNR